MRVGPTEHHFGGGSDWSIRVPRAVLTESNHRKQKQNVETPLVTFEFHCRLIFKTEVSGDVRGQQIFVVGLTRASLNTFGSKETFQLAKFPESIARSTINTWRSLVTKLINNFCKGAAVAR